MNYKHKNINEPLRVLVNLGKGYSGESFTLTFSAGKSGVYRHVCKYDAQTSTYTSCEPVNAAQVLCIIPPRRLSTGILYVQKTVVVEDYLAADGKHPVSETSEVTYTRDGRDYGVELTNGSSDAFTPSAITTQVLPIITRGRPGKTRWADLTPDEKKEVAALLPEAVKEKGKGKSEKSESAGNDTPHSSLLTPHSIATPSTPGIVRIGEGLTITTEGTLSIDWSYVRRKLMITEDAQPTPMQTEL